MAEKLSRKILEQARKQQDELEAEFGMVSVSKKTLKTAQTCLGPPELQNLDADELESDEDDVASVASEQFYENIVSCDSMIMMIHHVPWVVLTSDMDLGFFQSSLVDQFKWDITP